MKWHQIKVSNDSTHFLFEGNLIFDKHFIEVLKFHSPGLAPVIDKSGAYHINESGEALYSKRYSRTFNFYCNRSSVIDKTDWFHIDEKGNRTYSDSYSWTGNFQEYLCTVRDKENHYFHIDLEGNRIYKENYVYAGDFKDGIACVKLQNGLFRHIDSKGNPLNDLLFEDLGIFHKNFATAKDDRGWFHIDKKGNEVYNERYLVIEPFYNGFALVTQFDFRKRIIDEQGNQIIQI
jgi:hypothetical protein